LFHGSQLANGKVAMFAGLAISIAGLVMTAYPGSRRCTAIVLACCVAVAGAEDAAWWLKYLPLAVLPAGVLEAAGLLLGLVAAPLCLPGHVRKPVWLLAATVLGSVTGAVILRPGSTSDTIVF